jgi:hypothetical protein
VNNPSGLSQAEMLTLMSSAVAPSRAQRRSLRGSGASSVKPSNDRSRRRVKNRAARRARARNRR